jgi:hypothetical protein
MAGIIANGNLRIVIVQNQMLPKEGPQVIPSGFIDLTQNGGLYTLDLSNEQWLNKISGIQTLFIDNSTSGVSVAIKDQNTGHEIVADPHTQGFYAFMSSKPTNLQINGPGGPTNFQFFMINTPIPPVVWAAHHP